MLKYWCYLYDVFILQVVVFCSQTPRGPSPPFMALQALRTVLHDTEGMTDEDLGVLFMKIDANGSGSVDWEEFTGFLLQARS